MSNTTVYLKGKAYYLNPWWRDFGKNMSEDKRGKFITAQGRYSTRVLLPFDNRDDAEDHLLKLGIPLDGMFGNLLKRDRDTKEIFYKVTRDHYNPRFTNPDTGEKGVIMGPPPLVNNDKEVLPEGTRVGNGSDITVKLNVWIGTKAKNITWEATQINSLVEYVAPQKEDSPSDDSNTSWVRDDEIPF